MNSKLKSVAYVGIVLSFLLILYGYLERETRKGFYEYFEDISIEYIGCERCR